MSLLTLSAANGWYDADGGNVAITNALTIMLYVLLALSVFGVLVSIAALAANPRNNKAFAAMKAMLFVTILAGLSLALFFIAQYVSIKKQALLYYGLQITAILIAVGLFVATVLATHRDKAAGDTREITFAAVCIALSFALSSIRLWKMPQGGSVTLGRILPLAVYCYYFGAKKGLLAGFAYSMLELMQDPWIYNFWQVLLDYTVPFSAICLVGFFGHFRHKWGRWGIFAGMSVYACVRYVCHLFTGALVFAQMQDPALYNAAAWIYSATYNSVVFIDLAIAIVLGIALLSTNYFPRYMERFVAQIKSANAKRALAAVGAENVTQPETDAAPVETPKETTTQQNE